MNLRGKDDAVPVDPKIGLDAPAASCMLQDDCACSANVVRNHIPSPMLCIQTVGKSMANTRVRNRKPERNKRVETKQHGCLTAVRDGNY